MAPTDEVMAWVRRFVVGEHLCPFAAPSLPRTRSVEATGAPQDVLRRVADEIADLLDDDGPDTTLVVVRDAAPDLDDLLDLTAAVDALLDDAGLRGTLQVVGFHPAWRFEGEAADHPGNWTNRAPWPVLHLLREADVARAVRDHAAAAGIPARNRSHLEALGRAEVRRRSGVS